MLPGKWPSRIGAAALFGAAARAFAFAAPKETDFAAVPLDAISPKPTPPPVYNAVLQRRQGTGSSKETFLFAPDNTCGYISGLPGALFACNGPTETCVLITSSAGITGAVGCCDAADCGLRITCLDYDQISSSSRCDDGCMVDTFTVKCTDTTARYCNTASFSGNIFDYYCNSLSISTPQAVLTTYKGETDGRSFTELVYTPTSSETGTSNTEPSSSVTETTESSSSATTTSPAQPSESKHSGGHKSKPIGAIVGGVVGGLAVVGLVAVGAFYLLRRRGKTATPSDPPQPMQQQQSPAPGLGPGGAPVSFYGSPDPSKGAEQQFVQTYPTPPPQQGAELYPGGVAHQQPYQQHEYQYGAPQQGYVNGPTPPPVSPSSVSQPGYGQQGYQSLSPQTYAPGQTAQPPESSPTVHETSGNMIGGPQQYNADHRGELHELD
ncbi:hypothetical protein VTK73DRAFT_2010 [Phialemonium thermophilum]|uniref:Mid2 domain-containing protein n=1 Tax=Phialemonium thermophilum TaxID=223376 RepID=A0ABR3X6L4_9PEZI